MVTSITTAIRDAAVQGRTFTNARNALIGHALLTGVKQVTIVNESGVDKGDVSRINGMIKKLTPAQANKLKKLTVPEAITPDSVTPWAAFGDSYLTRKRNAPATRTPSEPKVDDVPAAAHDWLMASESREQLTARLTLLADIAARAESEWTEPAETETAAA
jgi:hypothetical protein